MLAAWPDAPASTRRACPSPCSSATSSRCGSKPASPASRRVIVQGRRPVWSDGPGQAGRRAVIAARDDTVYPIGDLTQTFAAVLVGQCVDRNGLNINQPVRRWTDTIPEGSATLRNVLSHASSGVPGEAFRYDPGRYAALTNVVDDCAERPFRLAVTEEIFDRLGMRDSVPGRDLGAPATAHGAMFTGSQLDRFGAALQRLAVPYRVDRGGKAIQERVPAAGRERGDRDGLHRAGPGPLRRRARRRRPAARRPAVRGVEQRHHQQRRATALGPRLVRAELQRRAPGLALRRRPRARPRRCSSRCRGGT